MYSKTSALKFMILWKEMCFTGYQAFRMLNCGVVVIILFFSSVTYNITFFIMRVMLGLFVCL